MYTIGTAALEWIRDNAPAGLAAALENKYVAFVGLAADRVKQGDAEIGINQHTVFFQVPASPTGGIANPITSADLYVPMNPNGTDWQWDTTHIIHISAGDLLTHLKAAAGFHNVLYSFQRGNKADMNSASVRKVDGVPFYCRDTKELYVYESELNFGAGGWALLTNINTSIPVGGMMGWIPPVPPPVAWHKCDGADMSRADYPDLFNILGVTYGATTPGTFKLPVVDSMMIRVLP